jgi:hypothetical protein
VHSSNDGSKLTERRRTAFAMAALPVPVESGALSISWNDCFRLHNQQGGPSGVAEMGHPNPKEVVPSSKLEAMARLGPLQDKDLVA